MTWGDTTYKHNAPYKGTFGYEISTSFDREYERGTSQVRVQSLAGGKVSLDVEHAKWATYGTGKQGRCNTRTASVTLDREQMRNLIAVLTEALAKGDK